MQKDFVKIHDLDATIKVSLRYATAKNFTGHIVNGYHPKSQLILTRHAALQLKKVQHHIHHDGYSLVIYDAFRPQMAVDDFVKWSEDHLDQKMKSWFYPYIDKADAFELGYIAKRSGHSRGSTVDLSIIKRGQKVTKPTYSLRTLSSGKAIPYLDDNTVDMGSSFDLMDETSWIANKEIGEEAQKNRAYLQKVMKKYQFTGYHKEWWHFTLDHEPYPDVYFNFSLPIS